MRESQSSDKSQFYSIERTDIFSNTSVLLPEFFGKKSKVKVVECGAPEKIRTPNLLIRSQMLYPIELRALF